MNLINNPALCTLTGASGEVDPMHLIGLSIDYPFLEWGVLYSPDRAGSGRYPARDWMLQFVEAAKRYGALRSIHLCGRAVQLYLHGDEDLHQLCGGFNRIQLNFSNARSRVPIALLREAIHHSIVPIITQHNANNLEVAEEISFWNHQILFDSSGGRGVLESRWPSALRKQMCGYAGGLGPDNIESELPRIAEAASGRPYWIDMESSLRQGPEDQLDLLACERVLEAISCCFKGAADPVGVDVSRQAQQG